MFENRVLDVRRLTKEYRSTPPFTAVSDVSFDLGKGEILGLLGPNGAGKTTIIQMLLSTLTPSCGRIIYFGKDLSKNRSEILRQVSFASTYISMPYTLTVEQSLNVFGRLYGLNSKELYQKRTALLDRFGIISKLKSTISTLSAGQVTRLTLVKAFMVSPKVVLLDEPTASLDPEVSREIIEFVKEQREIHGVSILFTSHNMAEVSQVCDRVLFLKDGKIIANDNPVSLARSVAASKLELTGLDSVERAVEIARLRDFSCKLFDTRLDVEIEQHQIAAYLFALFKAGISFKNIKVYEPTLEDYFIKMSMMGSKL